MPAYEIRIDDRVYAGHYHTQANAVFGAMRFRENEQSRKAAKEFLCKKEPQRIVEGFSV